MLIISDEGMEQDVSQEGKRSCKANNKDIDDLYDLEEYSRIFMHLNTRNLFGLEMVCNLAAEKFTKLLVKDE